MVKHLVLVDHGSAHQGATRLFPYTPVLMVRDTMEDRLNFNIDLLPEEQQAVRGWISARLCDLDTDHEAWDPWNRVLDRLVKSIDAHLHRTQVHLGPRQTMALERQILDLDIATQTGHLHRALVYIRGLLRHELTKRGYYTPTHNQSLRIDTGLTSDIPEVLEAKRALVGYLRRRAAAGAAPGGPSDEALPDYALAAIEADVNTDPFNVAPSHVTVLLAEVRRLRAALAEAEQRARTAEEALAPFAHFASMWAEKPINRGEDDHTIYAIHTGTPWAAELTLGDFRRAARALSGRPTPSTTEPDHD